MLGRSLVAATRGALLVCAVLVPLVWCPWTSEVLEINKQTATIVLVILATILALGSALVNQVFTIRQGNGLFGLLGLYVGLVFLSAVFSLSPYSSLAGESGQEYTSALTIGAFALYAFLGSQFLAETKWQRRLWSWTLIASGVMSLLVLPQFIGLNIASWPMNLVGTPNALAVYLVAMTTLGFGLWLTASGEGRRDVLPQGVFGLVVRAMIFITAITTALTLLAIDYWVTWVLALVGMGILFTFALIRAQEFSSIPKFVPPMLLFVLALVFLFIPSVLPTPFFAEAAPAHGATWSVVRQTLKDEGLLLGSGPGTFVFDYTKYHSKEVNFTQLWDVRFDRGAGHVATMLATTGVATTLAYLFTALAVAGLALSRLVRERVHDEWKMTLAPFSAWLVLFSGQFLYASNMTLSFMFWLMTAVILGQVLVEVKEYPFVRSPRAGLAGAFVFVLAFVILVTALFVTSSRYVAEVAFAQAISLDRGGADLDEVITKLDTAALRNKWSDIYYRNLGHALLLKTAEVLGDTEANASEVQSLIGASINASRVAAELSPANVVNWQLQGDVYKEVSPVVADAGDFAVTAYKQAIELAPNNPKYYVSLAQAYLVLADQAALIMEGDDEALAATAEAKRTSVLGEALSALQHALELKADYLPAGYYLASVYERQGELKDAIASMEAVKSQSPLDVGVAMQLALLYLKQGKNELAKAELNRALEISPNYSNARWYLATILESEDDLAGAIAELEAVAVLNPDNSAVTTRLERLQQGLADLQTPPPLEEVSPLPDSPITE